MSVEVGDKVTIGAKVISTGPDYLQVALEHGAVLVMPARTKFISVEKPLWRPKVGEWFTWSAGMNGYQCLWIGDQHVLYGKPGKTRPTVGDFPDMPKMRPCKDEDGDPR
jgi:hypothetical protein